MPASGVAASELQVKFATIHGQRMEAEPGLSGDCPACGGPVVAKCGDIKIWHWAHRGRRVCDPWWENETEWHRAWKGLFPVDWQEVVHRADSGERHIADVKTGRGWVLEFQHSYLKTDERRARESFYPKLMWVVDGTRRKRDGAQLLNAWNDGVSVSDSVRRVNSDGSALLREWGGGTAPVFFDLGGAGLCWVLRGDADAAYVAVFPRDQFIGIHRGKVGDAAGSFDDLVKDVPRLISEYESQRFRR